MAERHRDLLKVLRILARVINASVEKNVDGSGIKVSPSAVRIQQASILLEIIYGQETIKEVKAGKLVGLDPVFSAGST